MAAMPVTSNERTWLPNDREWTVDDLDALPDDGFQYELFDGVLVVSPAPTPRHQRVVAAMYRLLHATCPPELEVFFAPLDFRPSIRRSYQPDLLVVQRDLIGEKNIKHPPVLTVEVLSPSTRAKDPLLYPASYAASGVLHYWTLDPATELFTAYDLADGRYVEVATATGDETAEILAPFPVQLCPASMARG